MITETTTNPIKAKKLRGRTTASKQSDTYFRSPKPFVFWYNDYTSIPSVHIIPNFEINFESAGLRIYANETLKSNIFGKIDELSQLNDNWDGENSPAPSKETIELSKQFSNLLICKGIPVSFCYPLRNGGIQLETSDDSHNTEYEIHPDGRIHQLLYDAEYNLIATTTSPISEFEIA